MAWPSTSLLCTCHRSGVQTLKLEVPAGAARSVGTFNGCNIPSRGDERSELRPGGGSSLQGPGGAGLPGRDDV